MNMKSTEGVRTSAILKSRAHICKSRHCHTRDFVSAFANPELATRMHRGEP
jgi:hypothetical protein